MPMAGTVEVEAPVSFRWAGRSDKEGTVRSPVDQVIVFCEIHSLGVKSTIKRMVDLGDPNGLWTSRALKSNGIC